MIRHDRWIRSSGHTVATAMAPRPTRASTASRRGSPVPTQGTVVTPHRQPVHASPAAVRVQDYERIAQSEQIARLAYVKQAFLSPPPGICTRLTHCRSVAEIAAQIAEGSGLNVELARAAGLAHDCGHAPGGHAGEDALTPYLPPDGYDHAPQGALRLSGLRLSDEVLDAVSNHSWSRPSSTTAEGEVVAVADRIAYVTDDLADACRLGLIDNLVDVVPSSVVSLIGSNVTSWREAMVSDTVDVIASHHVVGVSSQIAAALGALRAVCNGVIYMRPASVLENATMVYVIRVVVDYIAGGGTPVVEAVARVASMSEYELFEVVIRGGLVPESGLPLITAESTGIGVGVAATIPVPAVADDISPVDASRLCMELRERVD